MPQAWHTVELSSIRADSLEARATAPAGSPWFDGHFPGRPILPGIAMIALAFEAAQRQELKNGAAIRLKSVTRVRFKKAVRPDEHVTILLTREQRPGGTCYRFTILVGGDAGCTGILHIEPLAEYNLLTTAGTTTAG
jgi:3-hydroxyacyl-[acyl-carrier-protein] dehydratase